MESLFPRLEPLPRVQKPATVGDMTRGLSGATVAGLPAARRAAGA